MQAKETSAFRYRAYHREVSRPPDESEPVPDGASLSPEPETAQQANSATENDDGSILDLLLPRLPSRRRVITARLVPGGKGNPRFRRVEELAD